MYFETEKEVISISDVYVIKKKVYFMYLAIKIIPTPTIF